MERWSGQGPQRNWPSAGERHAKRSSGQERKARGSEQPRSGFETGDQAEGGQTGGPNRGTELGGPDVRRPTPRRGPIQGSRTEGASDAEPSGAEPGGSERRDPRVCEPKGAEPRTSKAKGPICWSRAHTQTKNERVRGRPERSSAVVAERTSASSDRAWPGHLPYLAGPCIDQTPKIPGGQAHLRRERAHLG